MSIAPTGKVERTESGRQIVIERTFNAPIEDVWESIVDPGRMNRWIGTWTGEGGSGSRVKFVMTAEGQTEGEDVEIHTCEPPRHLDVTSAVGDDSWRMSISLNEDAGVTPLRFTQAITEGEDSSSYGIGWEYYADRLVATHTGEPFPEWDDYYPAQQDYWQATLQGS